MRACAPIYQEGDLPRSRSLNSEKREAILKINTQKELEKQLLDGGLYRKHRHQ